MTPPDTVTITVNLINRDRRTHEVHEGATWNTDRAGNLHLYGADGLPVASYAAGIWTEVHR